DLAGFMGKPSSELYTRWTAEFGAWNGLMRTHGHDGREPWLYNATAQTTLRENLKTRYSLYPYIYTTAWQGYSEGVPMMRAMILEDGSRTNPAAWNLNAQYYFGDWFLVAPAAATTPTQVQVWLPPNTTWYDYADGLRYEGGPTGATITVAAPLEKIPVFLKAGAIVPKGPEVDYADEVPLNPLTLDIYPSGTTSYTLYEDDGVTRRYLTEDAYATTTFTSVQSGTDIQFQIAARQTPSPALYTPPARDYNLTFNHVHAVTGVEVDTTALPAAASLAAYNAATSATYWADASEDLLYVKLPDDAGAHTVDIASAGIVQPPLGDPNQGVPPPTINPGDRVEAEDTDMGPGVSRDTEWKGYTGSGFAKGFQSAQSSITFQANIARAGTYDVSFRVTNGKKNAAQYDDSDRTAEFLVDSVLAADLAFPVTPTWGDAAKNGDWRSYPYRVQLTAGVHTFRVQLKTSGNTGNFNLDSLTFARVDTSIDAFATIEAENARAFGGGAVEADGADTVFRATADGAWLQFPEVRGEDKGAITLRVKASTAGTITVHENGVGDKILGVLALPTDDAWHTVTIPGTDTDQIESDIFLAIAAATPGGPIDVAIDWFRFDLALPAIADGAQLEWEDGIGRTQGGTPSLRVDTEWKGYTGRGYVAGWKDAGDWAQVTANVTEPGIYTVSLRIGAGTKGGAFDTTPRTAGLYLDGTKVADLAFEVDGPWGDAQKNGVWDVYAYADIELPAGPHDLKVVSEGTPNPGNFNLDNITFAWDRPIPGAPVALDIHPNPTTPAAGGQVTFTVTSIDADGVTVADVDPATVDWTSTEASDRFDAGAMTASAVLGPRTITGTLGTLAGT
ncbi:MAG: carbohydrate-binding protein, partial [Bifidobacteriaceae bacterium]|nr:carbohydrate-binding protein [Bifidobacteriaceae bacterium]